jgi:hypothetical protein
MLLPLLCGGVNLKYKEADIPNSAQTVTEYHSAEKQVELFSYD